MNVNQDQLFSALKKDVRSLLVSAKFGLAPEQLKRDYQALVGHPLPLRALGFRYILDMVKDMPDVVYVDYQPDGNIVLKAVGDETTRGIQDLVAKQKTVKRKPPARQFGANKPYYPQSKSLIMPRRVIDPPPLPAHLRSQLRQLLSQGPLRLSELEKYYTLRFGRRLQPESYGYYSLTELLSATADFITVEQGRSGSLLKLKSVITPLLLNPPRARKQEVPNSVGKLPPNPVCQVEASKERVPVIHPPALEVPKTQQNQQPEASLRHQSMEESILKLEEQMRQQILKMGDASTVSTELKNKLHQIVTDNSNGIALHQLPLVYKKTYGEELPLAESGFVNVSELVGALSDVLCVNADPTSSQEETGRGQLIVKQTSSTPEKTVATYQQHQHSSGELTASAWDTPSKEDHIDHVEVFTQRKVNKSILEVLPPVPVAAAAVPLDLVLNQRLKAPVRRKERELMSVVVEHTKTPGHFYLRFEGPEARLLEDMMLQMRTFYTCPEMSQRHKLLDVFVRPGQVCCVSPQSIWCYRVVILQVLDSQQVEVYYVDFGDVSVVDKDRLCFLKACYATLPAQAVPSSLSGIRPVQGSWTAGAIGTFQKMCSGRLLVGAIDSYRHGFMQVYLCDTSTQEDKYAHSTLLTEGHAVACAKADYLETSCKSNPVSMYFGPGELQPVKMPECWGAVKRSGNAPSNQEKLTVYEPETKVMVDSAPLVTAPAVETAALCDVPDVPSVEESAPLPKVSIPQPEVSTTKSVPPAEVSTLPSLSQSGTLSFGSATLPEISVLDPANCSNNPVLDSQPPYPSMPTIQASTLHPPPSTTEGAALVAPPQTDVSRITKDDVQVNVNPFEALLRKDFVLCTGWDKGWQQGHNGGGAKPSTNVDTPKNEVLPAPVPGVDSHLLEQPATPEPLPQDPTPSYIPTTLATTAAETRSTGVEESAQVSPGLLFPMMSIGARLSPDKLFLHHASPLALRPATRMAGGLNFLKW